MSDPHLSFTIPDLVIIADALDIAHAAAIDYESSHEEWSDEVSERRWALLSAIRSFIAPTQDPEPHDGSAPSP